MNLYLSNYNIHHKVPSDFNTIHIVKINAIKHVVGNLNFSTKFCNQMDFLILSNKGIYSTLVELSATIGCFQLLQVMEDLSNWNMYPKVDWLPTWSST